MTTQNKIQGEISKWRHLVSVYCQGEGLDIGYGGYAVNKYSINIDLLKRYSHGPDPQHLFGDARDLFWFRDEVFRYVFSSHLLEDFTEEDKIIILKEWWRVIDIGGYLVLLLPDEQKYRAMSGRSRNMHHKDPNFNLAKTIKLVECLPEMSLVEGKELFITPNGQPDYNFLVVVRKVYEQ